MEQFGAPEALWDLEVENFPSVVTMDSHGNSFHKDLERESAEKLQALST